MTALLIIYILGALIAFVFAGREVYTYGSGDGLMRPGNVGGSAAMAAMFALEWPIWAAGVAIFAVLYLPWKLLLRPLLVWVFGGQGE